MIDYKDFQWPLDTETSLDGINIYESHYLDHILSQNFSNLEKPRITSHDYIAISSRTEKLPFTGLMGCCILVISSNPTLKYL